jgi:serine/threonine-protein kinase RsbW
MQAGALKLTIESRFENVPLVGISINRICREAGLSEQGAFEVELCVIEAVNNVIRHAYREKPGKEVEIYLELTPHTINVKVADAGRPLPTKMFPPRHPEIDQGVGQLSDSGRGLFIIHSLMDQVTYATVGGRNIMSLTRDLVKPGHTASKNKD